MGSTKRLLAAGLIASVALLGAACESNGNGTDDGTAPAPTTTGTAPATGTETTSP